MSVRVAVMDPLPLFRRGVMAALGGDVGSDPQGPDDIFAWIQERQRCVLFLTLQSPHDWSLLEELRGVRSELLVVALLLDASTTTYVRAILAGAATAVPRDAPPELFKRAFEAALAGESVLPLDVVRALVTPEELALDGGQEGVASQREINWLRALATGTTVAQLAQAAGYSERAMFRQLRELYARMGVNNRTEALMRAHEFGWL